MTAMMALALLQSHSWTMPLRPGCCVSCGGPIAHVFYRRHVCMSTALHWQPENPFADGCSDGLTSYLSPPASEWRIYNIQY